MGARMEHRITITLLAARIDWTVSNQNPEKSDVRVVRHNSGLRCGRSI